MCFSDYHAAVERQRKLDKRLEKSRITDTAFDPNSGTDQESGRIRKPVEKYESGFGGRGSKKRGRAGGLKEERIGRPKGRVGLEVDDDDLENPPRRPKMKSAFGPDL